MTTRQSVVHFVVAMAVCTVPFPARMQAQAQRVDLRQLQAMVDRQKEAEEARANKDSLIAQIVSKWTSHATQFGFSETWTDEITRALSLLSPERLVDAKRAESYAQLVNVVSGRIGDAPPVMFPEVATWENSPDQVEPAAFGSDSSDLVYFPVTPCRIVDTRAPMAGGPIAANSSRNFSTNTDLTSQGGNGAGCGIPTDPAAIAATITVVGAGGGGNMRAYPYLGALPSASVLNYATGQTLANTTIVPLCQLCGNDFSIRADYATVHVLVDVVGYFWSPVSGGLPGFKREFTLTVLPGNSFEIYSAACPVSSSATGGGYHYDTVTSGIWVWQSDVDFVYGDRWRCRGLNNTAFMVNFTCQVICLSTPGR